MVTRRQLIDLSIFTSVVAAFLFLTQKKDPEEVIRNEILSRKALFESIINIGRNKSERIKIDSFTEEDKK